MTPVRGKETNMPHTGQVIKRTAKKASNRRPRKLWSARYSRGYYICEMVIPGTPRPMSAFVQRLLNERGEFRYVGFMPKHARERGTDKGSHKVVCFYHTLREAMDEIERLIKGWRA